MAKHQNEMMPWFLLRMQMIALFAFIYGVFNFSLTEWLIVLFVYFLTGCLGVSITYHRFLSHQAFKAPRWVEVVGTLLASWGLIGTSIAWVNNHRAHHRYADTADDPHAPSILGVWKVQWFSMFTSSTRLLFIRRLLRDKFHVFVHRQYILGHSLILIGFALFGSWHAAALYYLVPACVLWNMGSFINTICHSSMGYRNYSVDDKSKNNLILGWLVWGEGWHNNHHYKPTAKSYGVKWWELDISYWIIRLIEKGK